MKVVSFIRNGRVNTVKVEELQKFCSDIKKYGTSHEMLSNNKKNREVANGVLSKNV